MGEDPRISVLMAVKDGARYLREAMESILGQSYGNFEVLIIDDGSTDETGEILASFPDPRIRLARNERTIGLAESLNRGIELARGEFIARMDCDDASLPARFAAQVSWMDTHPQCAAVSVKISLMSPEGTPQGTWPEDERTTTFEEIYRQLPKGNCVAHPGVMVRTPVLRQYRYRARQSAQDYDLWLRLCADGLRIEKIDEQLLWYRIHPASVSTRRRMESAGARVDSQIRWLFLKDRLLKLRFNRFDALVLKHVCMDDIAHMTGRVIRRLRALQKRLLGDS